MSLKKIIPLLLCSHLIHAHYNPIAIHFFHTTDKNSVSLFQFSYGDIITAKAYDVAFIPFDKAYINNYETTSRMARSVLQELTNQQKNISFYITGLYRFPFSPL